MLEDASVTVKLLVDEPDSDAARELAANGEELHAPRLMASEVANALWRKARLGQIERAGVGAAVALMTDMSVRWNDDETVSADAVRLALALDHPVYDCVYLALSAAKLRPSSPGIIVSSTTRSNATVFVTRLMAMPSSATLTRKRF